MQARLQAKPWARRCAIALVFLLALSIVGCGQQEEGPNYADEEALVALRSALEMRFDAADSNGEANSENLTKLTDIELTKLSSYRDRQFEDSKLQELVLAYINLLEEMRETAANVDVDYSGTKEEWDKQYDRRAELIKDFVGSYGLAVGDSYEESLDKLIRRGNLSAQKSAESEAIEALVRTMKFEKIPDGYGYYTYTCVAENTTEFNFGIVSIDLALYDIDGVKASEEYVSTSSWQKGERVRFETFSPVDAVEVRATVSHYEVV